MTPKLKAILFEDLQMKRDYPCHYDRFCRGCGNPIYASQPVYFMGDKKVICQDCLAEMQEEFEE